MRTSRTLFLSPLPASDLIPVSPSEFSFELPLGNVRTFFKCHLFWSQGVSQLQGDGVMDAWNNVKMLREKFWFDDNFVIIYSNFKPRQFDCFKTILLQVSFCILPAAQSLVPLLLLCRFSNRTAGISSSGLEAGGSTLVSAGGKELPEIKQKHNILVLSDSSLLPIFFPTSPWCILEIMKFEELFPMNVVSAVSIVLSYYRSTWLAMCHE